MHASRYTRLVPVAALAVLLTIQLIAPALAVDEVELVEPSLTVELSKPTAGVGAKVQVKAELVLRLDEEVEHDDPEQDLADAAHHQPDHRAKPEKGPKHTAPDWMLTVDLGDHSDARPMDAKSTGSGVIGRVRHSYAEPGTYEVQVTATSQVDGAVVTAASTVEVVPAPERVHGEDRFTTAVEISRAGVEAGTASAVLLARADSFADALAASSLALVEQNAPLLLTGRDEVPAVVLEEIARVLPPEGGRIIVFGGEAAISADVAATLEELGYAVERVAGPDRIATALAIADRLLSAGIAIDEVIIANAGDFPDALAAGSLAALNRTPVLLTDRKSLDPRVLAFLKELDAAPKVLVIGGQAAIHKHVAGELAAAGLDVERISGKNRFETAAALAEARFPEASTVVLATGQSYADALAGAAYAARLEAPLMLVGHAVPEGVREFLGSRPGQVHAVTVLGGPAAVPDHVGSTARGLALGRR